MSAPARETGSDRPEKVVHLIQGEYRVSSDPATCFSTVLGSCVATCFFDPLAKIGGINHFLLPGGREGQSDSVSYGVHAMELLINALLKRGAARDRLTAKIFGGARMMNTLSDIGAQNGRFARDFLHRENIPIVGESLGGDRARRVQFWPANGRARQLVVAPHEAPVEAPPPLPPPAASRTGDVELF